jgi:hypothetical protein
VRAGLFTHFRDSREVSACNPHDANRCPFPSLFSDLRSKSNRD